MDGLEVSPPYRLFSHDLGAEERAMDKEETQEINLAKSTVASLISSYHTAQSSALREHVVNTMKEYQTILPVHLKAAIAPYVAHGPASPAEEKRREFLKFNPPPTEPQLPEGLSTESLPIFERNQAEYLFKKSDHQRALNMFLFGNDTAGEKQVFIPMGTGRAALRTKEGQVMVLNATELGIKEMAQKRGLEEKDIWLRQGQMPTGEKGVAVINGMKITSETVENLFELDPKKRFYSRQVNVESGPISSEGRQFPAAITKLVLDWKLKGSKDPTYAAYKARALDDPDGVAVELSSAFRGFHFTIIPTPKTGFSAFISNLPWVSSNAATTIIPVRGEPILLSDTKGNSAEFYLDTIDDPAGVVYDWLGKSWGSPAQAAATVKAKGLKKRSNK